MKKSLSFFFLLFCFSSPAPAEESAQADYASARLLSEYEGVGTFAAVDMGLDISLQPEWYTYWRMPGDNGLAPTFDWSQSKNVKNVEIVWPTPERITLDDMHSFGYREAVLFPLIVTPEEKGKEINLDLKLDLVICHDICVPQTLHVSKIVPAGKAVQSAEYTRLKKTKAILPHKENVKDIGIDTAVLGKDSVVISAYAKKGFGEKTDMIIQTPGSFLTAPPEIIPDEKDNKRAILKIKAPQGVDMTSELFGKSATILLINGDQAVEKQITF